jgi:two-component system, NtrC family, response regulator AtoC
MSALERAIVEIAPTDIPVLLVGESGTGKEVIARQIHRLSKRAAMPLVKFGCVGLLPETLAARLNSGEGLSGKGANTGGSLYLDEISQLDLRSQELLLHLLPDAGRFESGCSLGARVISSTTRNLEEEMHQARFREELYYRINGVCLRLPPLRQRKEDIPELLDFFLRKHASIFARTEPRPAPATMDLLVSYDWPGNIRELENVARQIVVLGDEHLATCDLMMRDAPKEGESSFSPPQETGPGAGLSLKHAAREATRHAERAMILRQLEQTHWNRKKTARELQISYKALLYKLKQLGLDRSGDSDGK